MITDPEFEANGCDLSDYEGAEIVNIRRGKGARSKHIYAQIRDKDGLVLVQATLDYCVQAMKERLPR